MCVGALVYLVCVWLVREASFFDCPNFFGFFVLIGLGGGLICLFLAFVFLFFVFVF